MKRFSETGRWGEPWYRKLKPRYKSLYEYLWSTCDCAGVWTVDIDLAAYCVGEKLDAKEALSAFGEKVLDLRNGTWLLPEFIRCQCGRLSPSSPPHKKVLLCLAGHSLGQNEANLAYSIGRLPDTLVKGLPSSPQEEEEEEYKEKERGSGEGDSARIGAIEIYNQYPRHLNRPDALRAIEKSLKTADPKYLLDRTLEFAQRTKGCDTQFIPYPASWFNAGGYESDPSEWDTIGRTNGHAKPESFLETTKKIEVMEARQKELLRRHHSTTQSLHGGKYIPAGWRCEIAKAEYLRLKSEVETLTKKATGS